MAAVGAEPLDQGKWGVARRFGHSGPARARSRRERVELPTIVVPDWAYAPAPVEERPPRPLAPSAIAADSEAAPPPSEAMRAAAHRGILIHSLLERLVGVAPGDRPGAARRWLERAGRVEEAAARDAIADQVCGILSDSAYAPLFGPGSLGEAPLAATLPDGRVIAGTVDRLLVEEHRILVVDFKTGRVPDGVADIPQSHLDQMDAYARALTVIFPGREVRAALLYTAGPALFELAA